MAKEMMNKAENAMSREVTSLKSRTGADVIREDLQALREDADVMLQDAKTLGKDLQEEGKIYLTAAEKRARQSLEAAKERGRDQYDAMTDYIRSNPGQSVAMAFVGGVIASMIFGRR